MSYRRIILAVTLGLVFTLTLAFISAEIGSSSRAASLCADAFPSVQRAIAAAGDGDTVRVPTGHYTETLAITKTITLQGGWNARCTTRTTADPAATVIDGGGSGPVISITQGAPTIDGLMVTGGRAPKGAGIFVQDASASISNTIVSSNVATTTVDEWTRGAGVYVDDSVITMVHSAIVLNVGEAYSGSISLGGGLYVRSQSQVVIIDTKILSNTGAYKASLRGGGAFIEGEAVVAFEGPDNLIANNVASYGGGIYTYGNVMLSGARVFSNSAGYGGGLDVSSGEGGTIANMIVISNSASSRGSGVYCHQAQMEFANNTIVGNGGRAGAGIQLSSVGTVPITLTNNIIAGHDIGILNMNETISPTLITNNVWDNGVNYQGVVTGTTDLHIDPLFVDAAGGDYHLTITSPMVDAGTTLNWLGHDYDGDARPDCVFFDIGADEVVTGQVCGRVYLPFVLR